MTVTTRAFMRAALAGAIATIGLLIEESRALSGVPTGAGTTIAVVLAAPILGILSVAGEAALVFRPGMSSRARLVRFAAGLAFAAVVAVANQTLYPRLYPTMHLALAVLALVGCTIAADGALSIFEDGTSLRVGAAASVVALSTFSLGAAKAARALTSSPASARALHENSELLRPVVRLAARYHAPADTTEPATDPLAQEPIAAPLTAQGWSVLLVTVDALRADHVGTYGYERSTTPNLDALAAESAVFEHTYTSAPQTSFAIASIMTGTHYRALRAAPPTWAEQFASAGYATAAFYPDPVFNTEKPRFTALEAQHLGFEHAVVDWATADGRALQVSSFVNELPRDRPFFAWAHLFEPHEPYDAREEYPFGSSDVDRYDSEIALADRGIGWMVRLVRARRPQTIVIVTADHGEAFGEHASRYHGTTLYEEQTRVPLLIHAPGLIAPERIARPVQTIDLLPTISGLVGVQLSRPIRGRDLFALRDDGVAFASLSEQSMLAVGSERLICHRVIATCTLFDLANDPEQREPIVSGSRVSALRASLAAASAGNAAVSH